MLDELKTKCNAVYGQAINLLENNGDKNEICRKLLDAATFLVEIGKISPADKIKSDNNARKLLDASKRLRSGDNNSSVYYFLTGKILAPAELQEKQGIHQANTSCISTEKQGTEIAKGLLKAKPKKEVTHTRVGYMFNWDVRPAVSFDDVAGLKDVKDAVLKKVLLPLIHPEIYEGYDKKNGGGLLLYGPPGTGKTMIAAAIAKEIDAKFCSVGASDIITNGIGNSEKAIDTLFKEARSFDCAVIFFDEIESLCPVTTHAQHARQIRSELLRQMQGLDSYAAKSNKILFLIAATNKPWEIDPAFIRPGRFGTRIYVGLPDEDARLYMLKSRIERIQTAGKVSVGAIDYDEIVRRTNGFNGADVTNLLDEAQEISIMRAATGKTKTLSQEDFDTALNKITSSAQVKDLQRLAEWRKENG